jgi:hypothetical protein
LLGGADALRHISGAAPALARDPTAGISDEPAGTIVQSP